MTIKQLFQLALLSALPVYSSIAGEWGKLTSAKQAWGQFKAEYGSPKGCGLYHHTKIKHQRRHYVQINVKHDLTNRYYQRRLPYCEAILITDVRTDLHSTKNMVLGDVYLGSVRAPKIHNIVVAKDLTAPNITVGQVHGTQLQDVNQIIHTGDVNAGGN